MAGAGALTQAADFAGLLAWRKGPSAAQAGHCSREFARCLPAAWVATVTSEPHIRLTVARRRRFLTVFPSTKSAVIVRGGARCGLQVSAARSRRVGVDAKTSTYSKKALRVAFRKRSSPRKAAPEKPVPEFPAATSWRVAPRGGICPGASAPPGRHIRQPG